MSARRSMSCSRSRLMSSSRERVECPIVQMRIYVVPGPGSRVPSPASCGPRRELDMPDNSKAQLHSVRKRSGTRDPGRRGGWQARYAQLEIVEFLDYPGAELVLISE